eukprot:g3589.t1
MKTLGCTGLPVLVLIIGWVVCISNVLSVVWTKKRRILLGLGLIEDRLGRFEEALASVRESQDLFRQRANGKPSSLVAKAGMSIAKILLKLALQDSVWYGSGATDLHYIYTPANMLSSWKRLRGLWDDEEALEGMTRLQYSRLLIDALERVRLPSSLRSLESLIFGHEFNHSLEAVQLPESLQRLVFGHDFDQSLGSVVLVDIAEGTCLDR